MAYPENTNGMGYGPNFHPAGNYGGHKIYAQYYDTGNYWIAYSPIVVGFVGYGDDPGHAANAFRANVDAWVALNGTLPSSSIPSSL